MDMRATIRTPYTTIDGAYAPLLPTQYLVASWVDVTGIPVEDIIPEPNLYEIEVVCDAETLTAIEQDATYTVVSSEPVEHEQDMDA